MAIHTSCPACGKTYVVDDGLAGQKLACRECDQLVRIPNPFRMLGRSAMDDAAVDAVGTEDDQSDDIEIPTGVRPPRIAKKKKNQPKHNPREVASVFEVYVYGLPLSIAIAMFCQVMIGLSAAYLVYENFSDGNVIFGWLSLSRVIWISVIAHEIHSGGRVCRWFSISLSIVGIAFSLFMFVGVFALIHTDTIVSGQPKVVDYLFMVVGFQFLLYVTNLIALLTTSAKHYCNRMGLV